MIDLILGVPQPASAPLLAATTLTVYLARGYQENTIKSYAVQ
jgi:hypothetical protein